MFLLIGKDVKSNILTSWSWLLFRIRPSVLNVLVSVCGACVCSSVLDISISIVRRSWLVFISLSSDRFLQFTPLVALVVVYTHETWTGVVTYLNLKWEFWNKKVFFKHNTLQNSYLNFIRRRQEARSSERVVLININITLSFSK